MESPTTKTALASASPAIDERDIRLETWVDDNRVSENQEIAFWIATYPPANGYADEIRVLTFRSPGFVPVDPKCWSATNTPICVEPVGPLPLGARPGGVTFIGKLRSTTISGRYGLSIVVGWFDDRGVLRRKAIQIEPLTIENTAERRKSAITDAIKSFFTDLGLPLVLAVLAYFLKKYEEERERSSKAAEEHGQQIQQTWTLMLPKMHQNAERHYMPISGDARSVHDYHASGDIDVTFFFFLLFLSEMRRMINRIGGFYFKHRSGEDMAHRLWAILLMRADNVFGRREREHAQVVVKPSDTFEMFSSGIGATDARIVAMRSTFRQPSTQAYFAVDAVLCEMLSSIVGFELNCAYEFWYGRPEEFPIDEFVEDAERVRNLALFLGPEYAGFQFALKAYSKELKRRGIEIGAS